MSLQEVLLLPNLLSLSRIAMAPVIGYFLWKGDESSTLICVILLCVAGITDGLDGYLARRMGKVSRLGIALDPIADKIFTGALILFLVFLRDLPLWLAAVVVGRDLLILTGGALLLRGRDVSVPSNFTGKYAFCAIAVLLASYVIRFPFGISLLTYVAVVLIIASTVNYGRVFIAVRKGHPPPGPFSDKPFYMAIRIAVTLGLLGIYLYELYFFVSG